MSNVDDFIGLGKTLMARAEKLGHQIHGKHHNSALFNKEISVLSIDELKAKIKALEDQ